MMAKDHYIPSVIWVYQNSAGMISLSLNSFSTVSNITCSFEATDPAFELAYTFLIPAVILEQICMNWIVII